MTEMGIITCEGRLALNHKTVRTATAVAKGKISDRDPPRQKSKSENQFILSIYYPKYYALQRQYIDQGHPEILQQALRSFGMTDEGISYLEETGQVRAVVSHGCPSRFRVTQVAERGAEVNQGALLFEYGEVAIIAHLPKRVVQYLEPETGAYAYPQNWPSARSPNGRRLTVRVAHVDSGIYSDHLVYLSIDGTCPNYMIGASFNLEFDIPELPNGPAIFIETTPVDKSIRPSTWLPPRGSSGGHLPLHKIDSYRARLAPTRAGAMQHSISAQAQPDPVPPLIKNGAYKPAVASGPPPVATPAPEGKGGPAAGNVVAPAPVKSDDGRPNLRRKSRKAATEPQA